MKSKLILLLTLALSAGAFAQSTGGAGGSAGGGSAGMSGTGSTGSGGTAGTSTTGSGSTGMSGTGASGSGTYGTTSGSTSTRSGTSGSDSNATVSAPSSDTSGSTAGTSGAAKKETLVSDISTNPQRFANKKVTVSGEVQKLSSDNKSFVINDQNMPSEQVLVINKSGANKTLKDLQDNDQISVSGKVQNLSASDIKRQYKVELDSELAEQMQSQMPVIVADSKSFKVIKSK